MKSFEQITLEKIPSSKRFRALLQAVFDVSPPTQRSTVRWNEVPRCLTHISSSRSNVPAQLQIHRIRIGTSGGVSPSYHGISVRFPTCAAPIRMYASFSTCSRRIIGTSVVGNRAI